MKLLSSSFTLLAAAALTILLGSNPLNAAEKISKTNPKAAPAWELKDVDGKVIKSSDFAGKVVLLDFWATWCGPCRQEIPGFVELQKKYGKEGLAVVGVSLDDQGPKVVKPFMKKYEINYPIVMDNGKTAELFGGVEAIPTTFLIDRKGEITHKHVGLVSKDQFEKEIKALLK